MDMNFRFLCKIYVVLNNENNVPPMNKRKKKYFECSFASSCFPDNSQKSPNNFYVAFLALQHFWMPFCYFRISLPLITSYIDSDIIHLLRNSWLTLVLLNLDMSCLCEQCRSRSVGFWCEGAVYLTSLGRPTDIGLQLGKACYPCSG